MVDKHRKQLNYDKMRQYVKLRRNKKASREMAEMYNEVEGGSSIHEENIVAAVK